MSMKSKSDNIPTSIMMIVNSSQNLLTLQNIFTTFESLLGNPLKEK